MLLNVLLSHHTLNEKLTLKQDEAKNERRSLSTTFSINRRRGRMCELGAVLKKNNSNKGFIASNKKENSKNQTNGNNRSRNRYNPGFETISVHTLFNSCLASRQQCWVVNIHLTRTRSLSLSILHISKVKMTSIPPPPHNFPLSTL